MNKFKKLLRHINPTESFNFIFVVQQAFTVFGHLKWAFSFEKTLWEFYVSWRQQNKNFSNFSILAKQTMFIF